MIDRHVRCLGVGICEGHPHGVFDNHPRSYRGAHIGLSIISRSPFKRRRADLKLHYRLGGKMSLLNRKVQLAFGSAVLTLLIAGGMSYHAIAVSSESDRWVRHTHQVLETLEDLLSTIRSIES